jgi:hypothetical protein
MADTARSLADILTLCANNTTGAISPQDIRDVIVSLRNGHGQIYVAAVDSAAVTISDTTNYFEATSPAWTLTSDAYLFDESAGNGRLTYTGIPDVRVHVTASVSFTVAGANDVLYLRLGENGTPDEASEVHRKVGTGSDVGAVTMHLNTTMATGEYISLFVRNTSAADDITIEVADIQVISMID